MKRFFFTLFLMSVSLHLLYAQKWTVASYNVRYDNPSDAVSGNGWKQRCPVVSQLILFNDFDIFGAQEVLYGQLNDLLGALPQYGYVGVGRDDGKTKGEYAPIFYKKEKFNVLQSGHFWLSEETGYPNKGWDAVLPRICTWAELEDRESKMKVWFFNLHMDHVGVEARRESAKLVLMKIKEMCGTDPVILTGDFNVDQADESYKYITDSGILADSYEIAKLRYAFNGTFNDFDPDVKTDERIDHVFVSPALEVEKYGILTDTYRWEDTQRAERKAEDSSGKENIPLKHVARVPSDHFPVKVELKYTK